MPCMIQLYSLLSRSENIQTLRKNLRKKIEETIVDQKEMRKRDWVCEKENERERERARNRERKREREREIERERDKES